MSRDDNRAKQKYAAVKGGENKVEMWLDDKTDTAVSAKSNMYDIFNINCTLSWTKIMRCRTNRSG